MTTLDNLLQQGQITLVEYLERIPGEYIPKREALIQARKQAQSPQDAAMSVVQAPSSQVIASGETELPAGAGYADLQRKINQQGQIA